MSEVLCPVLLPKPVYTLEQQNALEQAQSYLQFSSFLRQGLIDQLSSEYGSVYPVDVATWAADTVGAEVALTPTAGDLFAGAGGTGKLGIHPQMLRLLVRGPRFGGALGIPAPLSRPAHRAVGVRDPVGQLRGSQGLDRDLTMQVKAKLLEFIAGPFRLHG